MKKLRKKDRPNLALLQYFGHVALPAETSTPGEKLILQRPFPKPRAERASVREARATGLCIYCRLVPAHYYGPEIGFGAGCDACAKKRRSR